MENWQSILLGAVQGLTEFIPVSSSGHLKIVEFLFQMNTENFHLFLEFINFGTLLALLIFFRKRIIAILQDVFKNRNYRLAISLLITSIPAGLVGLILGHIIENGDFFNSIFTCLIAMGLVGLLMIIIDNLPHLKPLEDENQLTAPRALAIGLSQVFALIPGVSRSGSTIIAGRIVGLDSKSAAEYSFLASIPIMCGVCLKMFLSSSSRAFLSANLGTLLLSNLVAFIVGLAALKFLLGFLKRPGALQSFGRYRVVVSCILLGVLLILA